MAAGSEKIWRSGAERRHGLQRPRYGVTVGWRVGGDRSTCPDLVNTLLYVPSKIYRRHAHQTPPQTLVFPSNTTVEEHCASLTPVTRLNCGAIYMRPAPRPLSHPKPSPSPVTCTYTAPLRAKLLLPARRGAPHPCRRRWHRCADLGYGA